MRKRVSVYSLAIMMAVICLLSGCASDKGKTRTGTSVSKINEFPITEELVELDMFAPKSSFIENFETNEFTKWFESHTNVKLNWEIASGDVTQALNLKLASGAYPDIIMGFTFSKAQQQIYGEQGILIDIKDLVDDYGYFTKKMLEDRPDIEESLTINDAIYGLPRVEESPYAIYPNNLWMYKPWLDKLGAEVPTTTDELYDLLGKIRDTDLNGNGKKDEIPLAARGVRYSEGIEQFIMNAFVSTGPNRLSMVDGKVFFSANTDEYKKGLAYLKKLYDENLLYRDSFTVDRTAITSLGENETPILAAGTGLWAGFFTINGAESARICDYVSVPPLKGPDGFVQSVEANTSFGDNVQFVITNACEYPEIAIKWVDYFFDETNRIKAHNKQGFRKAKEGEVGVDGQPALWAQDVVPAGTSAGVGSVQNKGWTNFGVFYKPLETDLRTATLDPYALKVSENRYEAYQQHLKFGKNVSVPSLLMSSEDAALYADYTTTIDNAVDNAFVEFVTGIRSLDKDWDAYVESLNGLGLQDYLKLIKKYAEK